MSRPLLFSDDEMALLADSQFFRRKAAIMARVRTMLEATHTALVMELAGVPLLAPSGLDGAKHQLVKGEHLEDCPYQYLDYPKHFHGPDKFAFRTLFWWGHHLACALILEGEGLRQYKRHIVDRFHQMAGRGLELSLASTLWEWRRGEGYTLPLTHDRKGQIAAVLAERPFLKIMRCVPLTDPRIQSGQVPDVTRETLRALLPIVTP
jgi:hypothetical protein